MAAAMTDKEADTNRLQPIHYSMSDVWAIEKETGKKAHSIWKILKHQYREKGSKKIVITKNQLSEFLGTKKDPLIDGMYYLRSEALEYLKKIFVGSLIGSNIQYGDHVEIEGLNTAVFFGYGYQPKNIDPNNLHLMWYDEHIEDEIEFEIVPYCFGDAPAHYFDNLDKYHGLCDPVTCIDVDVFGDKYKEEENFQKFIENSKKNSREGELKDYVAFFNLQWNVWIKKSALNKSFMSTHLQRMKYAAFCRKQDITKLIQDINCFEIDGLNTFLESISSSTMASQKPLFIGICAVFTALYLYPQPTENPKNAFIEKECDIPSYTKGHIPDKCGRIIIENMIADDQINELIEIFNIAYYHSSGGGIGGPTIFDLISGALSSGTEFIDGFRETNHEYKTNKESKEYFTKHHLSLLRTLMTNIEQQIRSNFNISQSTHLYITSPIFFSKIFANRLPKTLNDEYFHYHNDTTAYPGFSYTALLYLSNYGIDFDGGMFDFKHGQSVIPTKGKLLLMTSGGENEHRVSNVTKGERLAFTMAWSLDKTKLAGNDPVFLSERETDFH